MIRLVLPLAFLAAVIGAVHPPAVVAQDEPVVRALFLYMPTCDHCHHVVDHDLPPVMERFGAQFVVAFVDVSHGAGLDLFYEVIDGFAVPPEAQGVPLMVIGSEVLSGDVEIPARLADVVEAGLAAGGIDWPAVPGMEAIAAQADAQGTSAAAEAAATPAVDGPADVLGDAEPERDAADYVRHAPDMTPPTLRQRWAADPVAFGITLVVLAGMLLSTAWVAAGWWRGGLATGAGRGGRGWAIPALCVLGAVVAAYLAFVETTSSTAVCGPVGDCNAVQQSEYALLFGVLPVGVLGLVGYVAITALWAWQRHGPRDQALRTKWLLAAVLLAGVLFSIYLTLIELFVIHAICMWCVTSAVTMTLLLWAVYLGWVEREPA